MSINNCKRCLTFICFEDYLNIHCDLEKSCSLFEWSQINLQLTWIFAKKIMPFSNGKIPSLNHNSLSKFWYFKEYKNPTLSSLQLLQIVVLVREDMKFFPSYVMISSSFKYHMRERNRFKDISCNRWALIIILFVFRSRWSSYSCFDLVDYPAL